MVQNSRKGFIHHVSTLHGVHQFIHQFTPKVSILRQLDIIDNSTCRNKARDEKRDKIGLFGQNNSPHRQLMKANKTEQGKRDYNHIAFVYGQKWHFTPYLTPLLNSIHYLTPQKAVKHLNIKYHFPISHF